MKNLEGKLALTVLFWSRPVLAYSARTCSLAYLVALALIGSAAQRHKTVRGRVGKSLVHRVPHFMQTKLNHRLRTKHDEVPSSTT